MLSKIFSTATLVILAWLSVQVLHTQRALDANQVSVDQALDSLRKEHSDVAKQSKESSEDVVQRIEQISAAQVNLVKTSKQADPKLLEDKNRIIAELRHRALLRDAIVKVLKANSLGTEKQGELAADILLSTKPSIWKLSGSMSQSKSALRGLMAPIDILAAKWKRKDYSGNSNLILSALEDVLGAQPVL